MKKFKSVLKEKQKTHDLVTEKKILLGFRKVYDALLEKYSISTFNSIDGKEQVAFLNELNSYWNEDKGLTKKGRLFLKGESDILNESSTTRQKKQYMKKRMTPLITETFRQTQLKYKMYDVIDAVYKETKAQNLNEVMGPEEMMDTILESFQGSLRTFLEEVQYELNENSKED